MVRFSWDRGVKDNIRWSGRYVKGLGQSVLKHVSGKMDKEGKQSGDECDVSMREVALVEKEGFSNSLKEPLW